MGEKVSIAIIGQARQNIFQLRATNDELDVLHSRAASMDLTLSEYLRWRGLKPIGRLKSPKTEKALDQSAFIAYIGLTKELNRQGINLNQLTRNLNWAKNNGQSVEECIRELAEIRNSLKKISESIQHLGVNP